MAGHARLNAGRRWWLLPAGVLLAHLLALEGMARLQADGTLLRPMAAPMFTRLLQPQAVVAPPPVAQALPAAPVPRSSLRATASTPRTASTTQALASRSGTPEPVAADPPAQPAPAPVAEARPVPPPAIQAATPEAVASAAAAPAVAAVAAVAAVPAASGAVAAAPSMPASAQAAAAPLQGWPGDTRLNYRLGGMYRGGELHGSARVQWQREGSRYQSRVEIDLLLAGMVLTSQGEVTATGLMPRAYEEQRRGRSRGVRIGEADVVFADGRSARRPDRVQDTASQFAELSWRFATGREKLEVGRTVSFWMARPGAIDLWTYDIVEREMLQTPRLGLVEAWRLKPRPIANPRGNVTAEMWFAPSLQYLPVRIKVSMGDETHVDLLVDQIEQK